MSAEAPVRVDERRLSVDSISRVEGEGRLRVLLRGDEVVEARLLIFEAPRFFERLVIGRKPDEVIDIVARICGICPVAYQMTAAMAFERLARVELDPQVRALRRLMYWGEWIQSHALHVYLLHVPDFLGYPDALALAKANRPAVERGLRLKHAGVAILELLGGRAVHPVSLRVGGFSHVPSLAQVKALRPMLEEALEDAQETVRMINTFTFPEFERTTPLLALANGDGYSLDSGRLTTDDGVDLAPDEWDRAFTEEQREGSNALYAADRQGRHHLLGPTARLELDGERLHPLAAAALAESGGPVPIRTNIFRTITARAVELVHACADALALVEAYREPERTSEPWQPRGGVAAWSTEAPRGLLFHRYELDDAGLVAKAQIVPPTAQNQAAIDDDLRTYLPAVLALPDEEATAKLEALIRCYDPCISCATHFLTLNVQRLPAAPS
jgi:sulfhydrogenase subunit alpha